MKININLTTSILLILLIFLLVLILYLFIKYNRNKSKFTDINICPNFKSIIDKNKNDRDMVLTYMAAKHKLSIPNIPSVASEIPDCNNTNSFDLSHPLNLIEIMYMTEIINNTIDTNKPSSEKLHDNFMEIFSSVPSSDKYYNEYQNVINQVNNNYSYNINKSALKLFSTGIKVPLPDRYKDIALIPRDTPDNNKLGLIIKYLAIGIVDKELLLLCILLNQLYDNGDILNNVGGLKSIDDIRSLLINNNINIQFQNNDIKLNLALYQVSKGQYLFKINNLLFNKSIKCTTSPCKIKDYIDIFKQYMSDDNKFYNDYNNELKILNTVGVKFNTNDTIVTSDKCQTVPQILSNITDCKQYIVTQNIEDIYNKSLYDKCINCDNNGNLRNLGVTDPIPDECKTIQNSQPEINKFIPNSCVLSNPPTITVPTITKSANITEGSTTTSTTTNGSINSQQNTVTTTTKVLNSNNQSNIDGWDWNTDIQSSDNNSKYNDYLNSLYGNSFDTNSDNYNSVNNSFGTANNSKLDSNTFNINDIGKSLSGITGQILTNLGYAGFNPSEITPITKTYDNTEAGYSTGIMFHGNSGGNTGSSNTVGNLGGSNSGNSNLGAGYPLSFSYSGGIGKHTSNLIQKDFNGVSNIFAPNFIFAGNGSPDAPTHIRSPKVSKTIST